MASIESGLYDLGRIDRLAARDTAVHRIDPRAKVLTTLVFLVCVVSFGKYELVAMAPFAIYPLYLAARADLPFGYLGSRMLIAAPFAVMVGMLNPLLDRTEVTVFGLTLAAGWISFASIILRFLLTTAAALVLVATTGLAAVCAGIERLGAPDVFSTQLLFLYRYIFVLAEEAMTMARARSLRSFAGRGMGVRVYGRMLGQLLIRTYARAQRIYTAMLCRGFDGHVRTLRRLRFTREDWVFVFGWSAVFALLRLVNVPLLLGQLVTGSLS